MAELVIFWLGGALSVGGMYWATWPIVREEERITSDPRAVERLLLASVIWPVTVVMTRINNEGYSDE